jgi:hypothetical protein
VDLAVIGTFYGRPENTFALMHRLFVDGTRKPDEAWLMCETADDRDNIFAAFQELYDLELLDGIPDECNVLHYPTPLDAGRYAVIPYSNKINAALDATQADLIVYLDNGSMPGPDKYRVMAEALEKHPEWGAVFCTQQRTGFSPTTHVADGIVTDGYCAVNYTQVMHRLTTDRWELDMRHANPDLADALFWRALHRSLGDFHPAGGTTVHDFHHIPNPAAVGI